MSHEVETMAWAHEVPWHGLGSQVDPSVTPEEMAAAAGLDWSLLPAPMFAQVGDAMVPVANRRAWFRDSDNKLMATSSDAWRPLQPRDMLAFFRDYVAAGGATLETAGSLRGGQIVWALANLRHSFETQPGDHSRGYLLFTSPNKVGSRIRLRTTSVRVVCANTMALAERGGVVEYSQNHLADFDFGEARACVENAHEALAAAARRAAALQKIKLGMADAARMLAPFFGAEALVEDEAALMDEAMRPRAMNEVLGAITSAPGATPGSAWGVLNGVTYWADHMAGRDNASRMFRSWVGDNAQLKLDVERQLMELA